VQEIELFQRVGLFTGGLRDIVFALILNSRRLRGWGLCPRTGRKKLTASSPININFDKRSHTLRCLPPLELPGFPVAN